jgi:hypothetical protein
VVLCRLGDDSPHYRASQARSFWPFSSSRFGRVAVQIALASERLQATDTEWTANQAYIDMQVFLGRQAYLGGPAVVNSSCTLWLELERLKALGIQAEDRTLLHVPY